MGWSWAELEALPLDVYERLMEKGSPQKVGADADYGEI
jgi:hypothetical protein